MKKSKGQAPTSAWLWRGICVALLVGWNVLFAQAGLVGARVGAVRATADDVNFPIVDPVYIYNQLAYLTSHFQKREAGYVADQGHDHFAAYWAQEMARNLQGFHPQIARDSFAIQG